jgi:hypothetical protein
MNLKGKRSNRRFALFCVFLVPIIHFIILTANNTILGADARYLNGLFNIYHSPWIGNAFAVAVWFAIFLSFTLVKDIKQDAPLIGALFMANWFNLRLLMPDPDNWIYLLAGTLLILYFKNNPLKIYTWNGKTIAITHIEIGILSALIYFVYRNFMIFGNATDMTATLTAFLMFVPTYYLLYKNRRFGTLVILLVAIAIVPTGKFVSNAMPLMIYAVYLDFVSTKEFNACEKDKIMRYILIYSFIIFMAAPFLDMAFQTILI